jgi:hypothetical protein
MTARLDRGTPSTRTSAARFSRSLAFFVPLLVLIRCSSTSQDEGGTVSPDAGNGSAGAFGGGGGPTTGTGGAGNADASAGASGAGGRGAAGSADSGASGSDASGGKAGTSGAGGNGTSGAAGTGGSPSVDASVRDATGRDGIGGADGASDIDGSSGAAGRDGGDGGPAPTGSLIRNDTFWKDTSGATIYSQGGGVLKVGATYYWYGVKYNGAVTYAANPSGKNSDTAFVAVTAYSSTDLVNWKFENNVLTAASSGATGWVGRMGVAYHAATQKYVLVSQYNGSHGAGELFATSSTPSGDFAVDHVQATVTNVANNTTGDQTLFTDDDGKAYLICSSSMGRANLYVAPLRASDYLNIEPATRIFNGAGREGNAMFKYSGRYYFCSSDLHGWNASHTYCISATNIMGPYDPEAVMENTDSDFSHVSQTGFFITVQGTAGTTVIFAGDRWSDFAGNGIGYNQWCPLSFNGTSPQFQSVSEWSLNADLGTWAVGSGNNYALNPSFEADRVAVTQPAGWTTSTTSSGVTPFTNVSPGHTGRWSFQLSHTASYDATIEQTATHLPNGTYSLSAWVKSSGGQSVAQIYAKGFGGSQMAHSINSAITSFTQVTIPDIAVSSGTCQIGVTTTASANQSVTFDDVSFVRTGP